MVGGELVRRIRRIDEERSIESEGLLPIDVVVRVIQVRALLDSRELVRVELTVRNRRLGDVRDAVHDVW